MQLPFRVRWQDLKDLFRKCGTVLRADVALTADNRSKGFGTVLFANESDAFRGIEMYNGYNWQTRLLDVRLDQQDPTGAIAISLASGPSMASPPQWHAQPPQMMSYGSGPVPMYGANPQAMPPNMGNGSQAMSAHTLSATGASLSRPSSAASSRLPRRNSNVPVSTAGSIGPAPAALDGRTSSRDDHSSEDQHSTEASSLPHNAQNGQPPFPPGQVPYGQHPGQQPIYFMPPPGGMYPMPYGYPMGMPGGLMSYYQPMMNQVTFGLAT